MCRSWDDRRASQLPRPPPTPKNGTHGGRPVPEAGKRSKQAVEPASTEPSHPRVVPRVPFRRTPGTAHRWVNGRSRSSWKVLAEQALISSDGSGA